MKHKLLTLAAIGVLAAGATSQANAQFVVVDDDTKVSFVNESIMGPDGTMITVTVASVTIKETDSQGNSVFKTLKEHSIPSEDGGTTKITTQMEMIVAEKPDEPGVFVVTTNTTVIETPVASNGQEGTPVETPSTVVTEVPQENLQLPTTSTLEPLPDVLEETPAVSGQ
jgi:hypothetical protein